MTDICDKADQTIEQQFKAALYQSCRDTPDLAANGECHFCGETIAAGKRWCDASCRDDWEIINK